MKVHCFPSSTSRSDWLIVGWIGQTHCDWSGLFKKEIKRRSFWQVNASPSKLQTSNHHMLLVLLPLLVLALRGVCPNRDKWMNQSINPNLLLRFMRWSVAKHGSESRWQKATGLCTELTQKTAMWQNELHPSIHPSNFHHRQWCVGIWHFC
jgi:hypothetical protein